MNICNPNFSLMVNIFDSANLYKLFFKDFAKQEKSI